MGLAPNTFPYEEQIQATYENAVLARRVIIVADGALAGSANALAVAQFPKYSERRAFSSTGRVEFRGWVVVGSFDDTSSAIWLIEKHFFNSNGRDEGHAYADGNLNFTNVWDDRESLSYS